MRILWVCNICPPVAAMALGREYSVREGWLTGALERFLRDEDAGMELGICFPEEGDGAETAEERILRPMGAGEEKARRSARKASDGKPLEEKAPEGKAAEENAAGGRAQEIPERTVGKRVYLFGFSGDLRRPEVYDRRLEGRFSEILAAFRPDLVHIFGTEFPHALAMVRAFGRPERTLVGIQGLIGACAQSYRADLPERAFLRVTLRDVLRRDSLRQQQRKFFIRGERERETLQGCGHVTGRTGFDRRGSLACNPGLVYHKMNETMRPCFYEGKWDRGACVGHEIFISQGDYPLKGLHYLLQAMGEIRREFPDAHIRVAGISVTAYGTLKEKLKISGYGKYLRECIAQYGLEDCVEILGKLEGEEMKAAYLRCHVFVCPSALENSPNALGEAMLLGVPCVASRVGGIPDMAEDGKSALLFEKGNVKELAERIAEIFQSDELACRLSENAGKQARRSHDGDANYKRLLEIYREILADA